VQADQAFAYGHFLQLVMPRSTIDPRFQRARDRCLKDTTFDCTLVSASISMQDDPRFPYSSAQLVVLLPHDKVDPYAQSLRDPLPGEATSSAELRSQSTQAQNVTQEVEDVGHRVAQLADYRDRLTALSRRADVKVDDLIKIAGELSTTQNNLERFTERQRNVGERSMKERVTISLNERPIFEAAGPILRVWRNGMNSLSESTADALDFLIRATPWVPILFAAAFLLPRLWRILRRRQSATH